MPGLLIAVVLAGLLLAPGASANRLFTIDTPSRFVDPSNAELIGSTRLRARVLLPDGYTPRRAYPLLVLLHGGGGSYVDWSLPGRGDIRRTAAGLQAVVVMPEGGARGFYTDWWNGGGRGAPGWESFYTRELIGEVERRFRIRRGRRWHALAGLSMGGYGTAFLGSRMAGYFGAIASFSGVVDIQRPGIRAGLTAVGALPDRLWGPVVAFYSTGHNPIRLAPNLVRTRVFLSVGTGRPDPRLPSGPRTPSFDGVEGVLKILNDGYAARLRRLGVDVTYRVHPGIHNWPEWRRDLRAAMRWGLFRPVPEHPRRWTYRTVATAGSMWDLSFRFARPPTGVAVFGRSGDRLTATGSGRVTLTGRGGCRIVATLPFTRELPGGCRGDLAPLVGTTG